MRKLIVFLGAAALSVGMTEALFAQAATNQIAAGAQARLEELLGKGAMVKPAQATPLGKNWFRLETDAHIFTDAVSAAQVAAVLLDLNDTDKFFNGKKSKLTAKPVSQGAVESIVDFVSISVAPLGIQIKTPYRAGITTKEHTPAKLALEVKQLASDSEKNNDIKNLFATRYVEDITLNGKTYTYIRIYTIDEVNASILPGAKGALENSAGPINMEVLDMIIAAAKTK